MQTREWGPGTWKLMTAIAYNFPETNPTLKQQRDVKQFFESLADVMPCASCRKSWRKILDDNPVDVTSRETLTAWLYRSRNRVNNKLRAQYRRNPAAYRSKHYVPWAATHENPSREEVDRAAERMRAR